MPKIIVVVGPTASGKSALAVRLAKRFNGEVISADSRQVYRGLDTGTGKISKREMHGVRHHLLDVASPKKVFTAADFVHLARKAINEIQTRGKVPIVCGGTGFYIDALFGRTTLGDTPADTKLRVKLKKKTAEELFSMLVKKDAERARRMNDSDRHNPARLIRALELSALPQGPALRAKTARPGLAVTGLAVSWIGINPPRVELRKKIRARLHARMRQGMVQEARRLHVNGLSWKRMEELGLEYRYLALYLQGKLPKEEMLERLQAKIWQYAKRQMTYWRRNYDIRWFADARGAYRFVSKE